MTICLPSVSATSARSRLGNLMRFVNREFRSTSVAIWVVWVVWVVWVPMPP